MQEAATPTHTRVSKRGFYPESSHVPSHACDRRGSRPVGQQRKSDFWAAIETLFLSFLEEDSPNFQIWIF